MGQGKGKVNARVRTLICGCTTIDRASLIEATDWLEQTLEGESADVQISIVVGGTRCSTYQNDKGGDQWPKKLK